MRRFRPRVPACCAGVVLAFAAATALAVKPAVWTQTAEAQFAKGKLSGTVTTSLGEVRLGRKVTVLLPAEAAPAVVSAVAAAGKTLYAAAGNEAVIYRLSADKPAKEAQKFAELPGAMVCCLVWTGRDLLAGTGGEKAGIYRVDKAGKVQPLWTDAAVKYVWALAGGDDGTWYAATGPEGKVYAVDKGGKGRVVYHADKLARNILCLAAEAGKLYAGTDEDGLVIEIDPKAGKGRVLFDAPEKEIAAIAVTEAGEVLAATSDASRASADGAAAPEGDRKGKAEMPRPPTTRPASAAPATRPARTPEAGKAPATRPAGQAGRDSPPAGGGAVSADGQAKAPAAGDNAGAMSAGGEQLRKIDELIALAEARRRSRGSSSLPAVGAPAGAPAAAPPRVVRVVRVPSAPAEAAAPSGGPAGPGGPGNAVYRIRPDGLVETVFRRPVTILAMLREGRRLLLGTGNGGGLYEVAIDGDEVAMLADTDAKQVTALAAGDDGAVLFATANKGAVARLEKDLAAGGTFESDVLDARQPARWGTIQASAAVAGGKVTVATRSGNVAEPDEKTWSSWSKEMPLDGGFLSVGSPAGRFLQYRLTFRAGGDVSPAVRAVRVIYQVGNLAPEVASVAVAASPKGLERGGSPAEQATASLAWRIIQIKASDENGDALRCTVAFRELGADKWVVITDKLTVPVFAWDTRTVGDGTYELRVTASDEPSNPPSAALSASRISDPVVVDNTSPTVPDLQARQAGAVVKVTGRAADAGSRVVSIQYAVDSQDDWTEVLPADGICDSDSEKFSFEVKDLKAGPHRIAVRVADEFNNVGYAAVAVETR